MTSSSASVWGGEPNEFTASYTNNRKTGGNEVFDFEGNIIDKTTDAENYTRWKFDASGAASEYEKAYEISSGVTYEMKNTLETKVDGDGRAVIRHSERDSENTFTHATSHDEDRTYFIHSTVLGRVLTELDGEGEKVGTKVYVNGAEIAEQRTVNYDVVVWKHEDVATGGRTSITTGGNAYSTLEDGFQLEPEPFGGGSIPTEDPYAGSGDPENQPMPVRPKSSGSVYEVEQGCTWNYVPFPCDKIGFAIGSGSSVDINVNVRAPGGHELYHSLHSQVSVMRYDVRQIINDEDPRLTREMYGNAALWDRPLGGGNYGMLVVSVYVQHVSPFIEAILSRQQHLTPLSADESKKVASQMKVLKDKLSKVGKDCQKMVIDKLNTVKGFSLDKFLQYLEKGVNIYDGTKSEILLTDALHSTQYSGTPPGGYTVAKYFADKKNQVNALTSGTLSSKALTIFWQPDAPEGFSKARIFHEGLHGFGAFLNGGSLGDFGDKQIQALFGLKVDSGNTANITDYIDDHCF